MSVARQHIAALDADNLRAIERGAHASPFSVLGVHDAAGRRMLRVNAPGAWRVEARARKDRSILAILDQSQTPGLFAAPLDVETPYLLRIYWPGRVDEHEDPYSFSPATPDGELNALGETAMRGASERLGAHPMAHENVPGVRFTLWAPDAASVAVAGDFNGWSDRRHMMGRRGEKGLWELFIPRIGVGARYCFALRDDVEGEAALRIDPFARAIEASPRLASIVAPGDVAQNLRHAWRDARFLAIRRARRECAPPAAIYRIEPGAWLAQDGRVANWRSLGERLPPFASALGFSHVQIGFAREPAPSSEPVWMFAPPPELGGAEDFAAFVDACHEGGLGVLLEWDAPGLFTPGDGSLFVENILIDSALRWLETFHVDGLSIKGAPGGPRFIARLREEIEDSAPGALVILETDVDRNQGHANVWRPGAVIAALAGDASILMREGTACSERTLLPITQQTLERFSPAADAADPLALLRAVYALAWLTPGAKLMHMGAELGQHAWPNGVVAWSILDDPRSIGFLKFIRDINRTLRNEAPIKLSTRISQTMKWLATDRDIAAYIRSGEAAAPLLVAANYSREPHRQRLETPCGGHWRELINTDSSHYGGGDVGNFGGASAFAHPEQPGIFLLDITLPPCGTIIFRHDA